MDSPGFPGWERSMSNLRKHVPSTSVKCDHRNIYFFQVTPCSPIDLPVVRHFVSPRHACIDMLVSVIRSGFRDTQDRRCFEARTIFKHKMLDPRGLNTDFAFL